MENPQSEKRRLELAWTEIRAKWRMVTIHDGPIAFLESFERLPRYAGHLLAVIWRDGEICNGGFHRFFSNSTGVLGPEANEGYRAVGLNEYVELVEAAMALFGEPYPRDRKSRGAALGRLERVGEKREDWDPFHRLENRYYAVKNKNWVEFDRRLDQYLLPYSK